MFEKQFLGLYFFSAFCKMFLQHKILDIFPPTLTCFEKKQILLLEGTLKYYFTRKFEIYKTKTENNKNYEVF